VLDQGLKHATRGPYVAHEDVLCGPRCFSGIFVWSTLTLFRLFTCV